MERDNRTVADSQEGGRVVFLAIVLAALWLGLAGVVVSRSIAASARTLMHPPFNSTAETGAPQIQAARLS